MIVKIVVVMATLGMMEEMMILEMAEMNVPMELLKIALEMVTVVMPVGLVMDMLIVKTKIGDVI